MICLQIVANHIFFKHSKTKIYFSRVLTIGKNVVFSNICVQWPRTVKKIVANFYTYPLFRFHFYYKRSLWDFKIVALIDRWMLLLSGWYLRFDFFSYFSGNLQPYMIQFQTDAFTASIAIVAMRGFNLIYWQTTTC